MFLQKNNKKTRNIDFDEILMDVHNIPGYHRESFEGVLENPIKKQVFIFLGFFFFLAGIIFFSRLGFLNITKGEFFLKRAETNYLREIVREPERGTILDKDKNILTSNEILESNKEKKWVRVYPNEGFLHSIGFLTRKENKNLAKGASGLELVYNDILKGIPDQLIEEVNAAGEIMGSGFTKRGKKGGNILTSISSKLSLQLLHSIARTAESHGFTGGAAIALNPKNGEVLAIISFPEFDPNILSKNLSQEELSKFILDERKPFFNRAVSGLYPPGSIIKPAIAAAALAEGIIDSKKTILSASPIVIQNPYFPDNSDIFPDWKQHGLVDMKKALAISSNIYFYTIGGGHKDQAGLGIWKILKYLEKFGFNNLTGIDLPGEVQGSLPKPDEKIENRSWSLGDTYHISIGQGDIGVTPVSMAVYASMLSRNGVFYPPHLAKAIIGEHGETLEKFLYSQNKIDIPSEAFAVVREGMRDAVKFGTAAGLSGYPLEIAAKTGTAEVGDTGRVHSWSIGFAPYEDPKIAWAIIMENGPIQNTIGATFVASEMFRWIVENNFLQNL